MFKKLFFQGRVQEAADQIINLHMYCTFRHLLCALPGRLCIVAVGWSIRCWPRFRVQEGLQTPAAIPLRSSATAVTAPPAARAARRNRSTGRARCAAARRYGVRARVALAGLARAEIMPRTSRDVMAWWWMDGWVRRTPPCICRRGRRTYITLRGVRAPPHVSVDSYAAVAFVRICLYGLNFPFDDDKDRGSIFLL